MSLAVQAIILIRLDARRGEWVGVHELAQHMAAPDMLVVHELQALPASSGVQLRYLAGQVLAACVPAPQPKVATCA